MNIGRTQWKVGGAGNGSHTHTHTHIHSVPRDTQHGWSLGRASDAILTHVGVTRPLIKLMGYEHREDAVVGGVSRQWHTHTHTVSLVIHRVDGDSGKDRTQS